MNNVWDKLKDWSRQKSAPAPAAPTDKEPAVKDYETEWASPTKKYYNKKWKNAARKVHLNNRKQRLKSWSETRVQKLKKLGAR